MPDRSLPAIEDGFLRRSLPWMVVANAVVAGLLLAVIFGQTGYHPGARGWVEALLLFLFAGLLIQLIAGFVALFVPGARWRGALAVLVSPALAFAGLIGMFSGMGWGRPLRVQGRQVFPELAIGTDWAAGPRPDASALDPATRAALEALWLHDAQKEHASVPAFARLGWMLAAVGAPAELLAWSQRAAQEEVEHAQRCFALAAGYGGRTHTAEPMPDLLLAGLEVHGDPLVVLAVESLQDGCLLEDFNADVAAACAVACTEPVTRGVLEQIAREERSHAKFSWAVLAWTLQRSPETVTPALREAERSLHRIGRPRAAGAKHWALVAKADPQALRDHGRVPDAELVPLWEMRQARTRDRLASLQAEGVALAA